MLDAWPADEPPPPRPLERRLWPWLVSTVGAVGIWLLVLGAAPLADPWGLALLAVPVMLALVVVGLLARTRLPGWVVAVALVPAFFLSLMAPLWTVWILDGMEPISLADHLLPIYASTVWALTAMLICLIITGLRHMIPRR